VDAQASAKPTSKGPTPTVAANEGASAPPKGATGGRGSSAKQSPSPATSKASEPEPPLEAKPGAPEDPLVVVKIQGGNKGEYWPEGTRQFADNAGTARTPPNKKYVVLPKSQADALGFRPRGTPPKTTIEPRVSGGKQIESSGAGRDTHPITARTTRKPAPRGTPKSQDLEMAQPDPSAAHAFPRTIGADIAQSHGYNALLDSGELGILRPGNVSTGGVDSITVKIEGGKAKVYLNDFTSPGTSKPPKLTHTDWRTTLDNVTKGGRLNFGDPATEELIQQAIKEGQVYVRTVEITVPESATPGPHPRAGMAKPSLSFGSERKL
jgi:hypothetical protein